MTNVIQNLVEFVAMVLPPIAMVSGAVVMVTVALLGVLGAFGKMFSRGGG